MLVALMFVTTTMRAQEPPVQIANDTLSARWNRDSGLTLASLPSGQVFLRDAQLSGRGGTAKIVEVTDKTFGRGQAIVISYGDGSRDTVALYPRLAFALLRSTAFNPKDEARVLRRLTTVSGAVSLSVPAAEQKSFGTGGLLAPDKNPGSYVWLAIADPASRNGVVFGWLTQERGSGVLFSAVEGGEVKVEARVDYGRLRMGAHQAQELETLAIGYFGDARLGLESWADAVAKVYSIHLPPQPSGYCTWYSQPHGGAADEKHLAELAEFSATNLAPFGFSVVQIDDKWQAGISTNGPKRNFTAQNPTGPYPGGMKAAADHIKSLGLTPGIWFMPFAGTYYDPFFAGHQDWFVKREDGTPYETAWGGTCLDMTHPGAREHLRDVAARITRDWGFRYIKVDGLWTGTATRQQYVNAGYKEDGMGDAVFKNPDKTNVEAYRDGLRLLREAAAPGVFILGCNGPQNMRSYGGAFGLVDAMRIGPDNKAEWKSLLRGPTFGSRHYFLNGRIWYNDPDPVYVRTNVPLNHAQLICSWVGLSGQLNLSSEWLPGLPPERLDILKRTLPAHGLLPRPADLFESDLPNWWLLSGTNSEAPQIIGVFNWTSHEREFDYPLERLGLDAKTEYLAFDYWANSALPPVAGTIRLKVPAESCRIIAVRPRADRPQVLSTSRHISQGIVDLISARWDEVTRTLSGRSRVVGGDAYELRVTLPHGRFDKAVGARVTAAEEAAGVTCVLRSEGSLLRVTLNSPVSRELEWRVNFE